MVLKMADVKALLKRCEAGSSETTAILATNEVEEQEDRKIIEHENDSPPEWRELKVLIGKAAQMGVFLRRSGGASPASNDLLKILQTLNEFVAAPWLAKVEAFVW